MGIERILTAAARVVDERGYAAATTNDVAEEAGVSMGSLYQYFASKDDLLVALAERHVAEALPAVRAHVAEMVAARLPLEVTLRALLALALRLNDSSKLHAVLHAEAERTPAIRASLSALDEELVRFVAVQLNGAGRGCSGFCCWLRNSSCRRRCQRLPRSLRTARVISRHPRKPT